MIIGVNGFKGSGKDTVGKYLVDNYDFERVSFATKLKESAAALFNIDPELWEQFKNSDEVFIGLMANNHPFDSPFNISNMSARVFLQRYGTEAHREIFGEDFWVEHAFKDIDPTKNYVFTDARFPNELKKIRDVGGFNIQVIRLSNENTDTHASEVEPPVELVDFVVFNDFDFDFLHREIEFCMDRIEEEVHGIKYS